MVSRTIQFITRDLVNYTYGYKGVGDKAGDPKYENTAAYPQITNDFGLLIGPYYTIPNAIGGVIAGKLTDTMSKKLLLSATLILTSLTFAVIDLTDSYEILIAMRSL